jgi:TDG/mug DNA glycosylase family protein
VRGALGTDVLRPEHDAALLGFGIGFTDVVKRASGSAAELDRGDFEKWAPRLLGKLRRAAPRVACFHGLTAYRPFLALALHDSERAPTLGAQPEVVGSTRLFVVPNPSPANAHFTLADQAAWYDRLADFLATSPGAPGSSASRRARRSP